MNWETVKVDMLSAEFVGADAVDLRGDNEEVTPSRWEAGVEYRQDEVARHRAGWWVDVGSEDASRWVNAEAFESELEDLLGPGWEDLKVINSAGDAIGVEAGELLGEVWYMADADANGEW